MGSIPGVIIGAFALIALPDILRQFSDYRMIIFGLLLVIMMIVRPEGFIPSRRRKMELHDDRGDPAAATPAGPEAEDEA
jgi:branched-chain amino acid transport system permease protein